MPSETPRIIAIGELLWDLLPAGPRLGGAPANFAIFCGRLGNRAALASSAGDDHYGKEARALLVAAGLDVSLLQTSDRPTGTVEVTFTSNKQPHYIIHTDVAWDFIATNPDMLKAAAAANAVCFGTLGQRHEAARSAIRTFVEATASHCVRVCDVNLRMPLCSSEVLAWSMAHATILKLSDEELALVFSLLGDPAPSGPEAAAHALLRCFPACRLVALSLGPQGSLVTTREAAFRHPGFPIKLVDTVGAGDAFTAGVVHAYLRGASLEQMAEVGNLCGSYVASLPGATPALTPVLIEGIERILSVTQ